jgi:muramoyltetrapeptide carboxypeptidase
MDAPLGREEAFSRQLQLAGVFEELAWLIVARPENFNAQGAPFGYDDMIEDVVGRRVYPIVFNLDRSHTHPMITLAHRTRILLSARDGASVVVEQPMIAP